jgi:hypothetical protein
VTTTGGDVSPVALAFIGEWKILAAFEHVEPADVGGRVGFEWLPGERFLVERGEVAVPEAPDGIASLRRAVRPCHPATGALGAGSWRRAVADRTITYEDSVTAERAPGGVSFRSLPVRLALD